MEASKIPKSARICSMKKISSSRPSCYNNRYVWEWQSNREKEQVNACDICSCMSCRKIWVGKRDAPESTMPRTWVNHFMYTKLSWQIMNDFPAYSLDQPMHLAKRYWLTIYLQIHTPQNSQTRIHTHTPHPPTHTHTHCFCTYACTQKLLHHSARGNQDAIRMPDFRHSEIPGVCVSMYRYMHTYICICTCICKHLYIRTHTYIHKSIHARQNALFTHWWALQFAWVCMCLRLNVHA